MRDQAYNKQQILEQIVWTQRRNEKNPCTITLESHISNLAFLRPHIWMLLVTLKYFYLNVLAIFICKLPSPNRCEIFFLLVNSCGTISRFLGCELLWHNIEVPRMKSCLHLRWVAFGGWEGYLWLWASSWTKATSYKDTNECFIHTIIKKNCLLFSEFSYIPGQVSLGLSIWEV